MAETVQANFTAQSAQLADAARSLTCPAQYAVLGPQVEPEASWWLHCFNGQNFAPRPPTEQELIVKLTAAGLYGAGAPPPGAYPTDAATLNLEIQELIILSRLRDDPASLPYTPLAGSDPQGVRLPLSMFLQVRPQPLGAVINTARGGAFPVIQNGRELARYFENEPPGISHRLTLDYMLREVMWSPPRAAWIGAALDITIFSALAAAWFLKWRAPKTISFRPRPSECYPLLDVMFDRGTNSTHSGDGARRGFPGGVRPNSSSTAWNPPPQSPEPLARPGEMAPPEAFVPDLLAMLPSQPFSGTPRHPAYPSGHSTYAAAATRLLIEFFPRYREELCRLADNIGLARMWGGIHWRTDHTYGQRVGTAVAEMIIEQMRASGIPRFPDTALRLPDEAPTDPPANPCTGGPHWSAPPLAQMPPCCPAPAETGC